MNTPARLALVASAIATAAAVAIAWDSPPPPVLNVDCTVTADSTRLRLLADTASLHFGNPGHSRRATVPPGRIPASQAPLRSVLVFEDPRGTTRMGPPADIVAEQHAKAHGPVQLAAGQIIGKIWVESEFRRDPAPDSLVIPAGTSYIAACVPRGTQDGDAIQGLIIPVNGNLKPISGTFYETRVQAGNAWAIVQSSSKSSVCISCGRGWCQF